MRTYLTLLILLILSRSVSAQDTFLKTYDFFDGADETARNMFVVDDVVYILGSGGCDEGPCLHLYKLTVDGEVLMTRRYPEIAPATRCWLRDSSIYVTGLQRLDSLEVRDGYRLYDLDLDGNIRSTVKYNQENLSMPPGYPIEAYWPRGTIANDNKIIVYGDTSEDDGISDNFNRGLLVYYNMDLSFDTLVFIDPVYRNMELWNADLDADDNFSFLYDYDELINGEVIDYRTFELYDDKGSSLYRWLPPRLYFNRYLFLDHLITSENEAILHITPESSRFDPGLDLMRVQEDGNIDWREFQDFSSVEFRILDISETRDKNILVAGFSDGPDQGAHIRKVDIHNGEVIWDRAFKDYDDEATGNALTNFFNSYELAVGL